MKFFSAIVILALAVVANASVGPLGYGWGAGSTAVHVPNVWGAGAWGGPAALGAWGGPALGVWGGHGGAWGAPGVWGGHGSAWGAPGVWGGHGAWGAHAPATVVDAHAAPVGHASSYVAANRGSVHVAPLNGHIQSVKSLNVAPAPGTW